MRGQILLLASLLYVHEASLRLKAAGDDYIYNVVRELEYSRKAVDEATQLGLILSKSSPKCQEALLRHVAEDDSLTIAFICAWDSHQRSEHLKAMVDNDKTLTIALTGIASADHLKVWLAKRSEARNLLWASVCHQSSVGAMTLPR